ncbi:MAG: protein-L-isoaspartate O-methyltransferase family protein, partial [Planctomycetota bacterium]
MRRAAFDPEKSNRLKYTEAAVVRASRFSLCMALVAALPLHQPRIAVAQTSREPAGDNKADRFPLHRRTVESGDQRAVKAAREKMVQTVVIQGGIKNQRVIKAMADTPRHEFVPRARRALAYEDMALPISERQTISSPFIVAFMTETIDPQPADRVLEIGTGSGYQAAVLSPLVRDVYTIEIVESLA